MNGATTQVQPSLANQASPMPPDDLIQKHAGPGPRYTSYPTAPYWTSDYGSTNYRNALTELGVRAELSDQARDVSLYLHIPFCEHRCTFCACNVVISRAHERGMAYIDELTKEMDSALEAVGSARLRVVQMHWGGGTPTWLTPDELDVLLSRINERFDMAPDREQSIEIDPRVTTNEQLDVLRKWGLNRVSMGVQDFNPQVQQAVNRIQSVEQTASIIQHARSLGIAGINADLIYGLPHQTIESFNQTMDTVLEMGIDRFALYNFAYLPDKAKHQSGIKREWLPDAQTRMGLFRTAIERFGQAQYAMIGLDHFARKDDELTQALHDGSIQRNFMGYTTRAGRDMLSFGVSSISRVGRDFIQNVKQTSEYSDMVANDGLPVERGMRLTDDDLLRESVIQQIMCFGRVDFAKKQARFGVDLLNSDEVRGKLDGFVKDGLIELDGSVLSVTDLGRFFLRNVAMTFDAYLSKPPAPETIRGKTVQVQFSRTI